MRVEGVGVGERWMQPGDTAGRQGSLKMELL